MHIRENPQLSVRKGRLDGCVELHMHEIHQHQRVFYVIVVQADEIFYQKRLSPTHFSVRNSSFHEKCRLGVGRLVIR
jgi:predicted NUDIX family phosphoesterase